MRNPELTGGTSALETVSTIEGTVRTAPRETARCHPHRLAYPKTDCEEYLAMLCIVSSVRGENVGRSQAKEFPTEDEKVYTIFL